MRIIDMKIALVVLVCIPWSIRGSPSSSASAPITGIARGGKPDSNVGERPAFFRAGHIDRKKSSSSSLSNPRKTRQRTAVIVGGGPGGLAAALILSKVKKQGEETGSLFDRIIVLDERPKESFDPTRAYGFNINKRGQRFTDAFNIDLSKRAVAHSSFLIQSVPPDPKDVFDPTPPKTLHSKEKMAKSYTLTRHEMIKAIEEQIVTENKSSKKTGNALIEVHRNARCEHIEPTEDGLVKIVLQGRNKNIITDFCVGADGISSRVRRSLEDGRFDPEKWSNAQNPAKRFGLKQYKTPSTGLRIQGLRVDPDFAIPKGGSGVDCNTQIPLDTQYIMTRLQSTTNGDTDCLPLSIISQKDPHSASALIVSICREPNHDVWNPEIIRTDDDGQSAKEFFEKTHPRFDWDKIVKKEEWKSFASRKGISFPPCQYSPSMYVSSNPSYSDDNVGAGVALLGDALHAFPPDLGQGVNKALDDAMLLGKSFEEAAIAGTDNTDSFMTSALKLYQERNLPEVRAIIALSRFGAPFQYGQKSFKFVKFLWFSNTIFRLLLNMLTFGLTPKPAAIIMMENPDMEFHQIMKKANALTAVLWSSLLLLSLSLIWASISKS